MKGPVGFSLAIAATASLAFAGGGGDDKDKKANSSTLAALGQGQQGGNATLNAAPGEGFTVSVGDEFSVNLLNRVQVRWTFASYDHDATTGPISDTNSFSIPSA